MGNPPSLPTSPLVLKYQKNTVQNTCTYSWVLLTDFVRNSKTIFPLSETGIHCDVEVEWPCRPAGRGGHLLLRLLLVLVVDDPRGDICATPLNALGGQEQE